MMDRRGESLVLDVLTQLIMLAAIFGIVFLFLPGRIDSADFFQEFYSRDIQLLSELAVSAPGDVTLLYDNLRDEGFTFGVSQGVISVIRGSSDAPDVVRQGFGVPSRFSVEQQSIEDPSLLVALKSDSDFAFREAAAAVKSCSIYETAIKRADAQIFLQGASLDLERGIREVLQVVFREGVPIVSTSTDGNIHIEVIRGRAPAVKSTASVDSKHLSCILDKQMSSLVPVSQGVFSDANDFVVQISPPDSLSDRELGHLIGQSLVVYLE